MRTSTYPEFAAIEQHIRQAQTARTVVIAEALAETIFDTWNAIKTVPALLESDRQRALRSSYPDLGVTRH